MCDAVVGMKMTIRVGLLRIKYTFNQLNMYRQGNYICGRDGISQLNIGWQTDKLEMLKNTTTFKLLTVELLSIKRRRR
jgi:hypothetical protein